MTPDRKRTIGPNAKKLIFHKMSLDAIPSGGGIMDGIAFLKSPERIRDGMAAATKWVFDSIDAIRSARGGDAMGDDEAIAGEILRQIDERKKQARGQLRVDSD